MSFFKPEFLLGIAPSPERARNTKMVLGISAAFYGLSALFLLLLRAREQQRASAVKQIAKRLPPDAELSVFL